MALGLLEQRGGQWLAVKLLEVWTPGNGDLISIISSLTSASLEGPRLVQGCQGTARDMSPRSSTLIAPKPAGFGRPGPLTSDRPVRDRGLCDGSRFVPYGAACSMPASFDDQLAAKGKCPGALAFFFHLRRCQAGGFVSSKPGLQETSLITQLNLNWGA